MIWTHCVTFNPKYSCTAVVSISCFTSCSVNMFVCLKPPQRWWRAPAAPCSSVSCSSTGTRCSTLWKWSRDTLPTRFSKCPGVSSRPSWLLPSTWMPSTACTQTTSTEPSSGETRNCWTRFPFMEKKRERMLQPDLGSSLLFENFSFLHLRTAKTDLENNVQMCPEIVFTSRVWVFLSG